MYVCISLLVRYYTSSTEVEAGLQQRYKAHSLGFIYHRQIHTWNVSKVLKCLLFHLQIALIMYESADLFLILKIPIYPNPHLSIC